MSIARDRALTQLDSRKLPGWPAHCAPRRREQGEPADPRDQNLAEQITIGVTKNLLLLQHLIAHYSGRKPRSVDPLLQKIVAIGLYQLRFLSRIPQSAAVHEAVEQAKRFGRARGAGFVNAVLREAQRRPDPPLPTDYDPVGYAKIVLSHPAEMFSRLAEMLGAEDALRFCRHDNEEPPTIVRLSPTATVDDLRSAGGEVIPHDRPGMFIVRPAVQAILADWAQRGIAQVQDPTAAGVVEHLDLAPGQTVLDRCCGMGTKTLQIRPLLGEMGQIVAMDPSEQRTEALTRLISQRALSGIVVCRIGRMRELTDEDARVGSAPPEHSAPDAPVGSGLPGHLPARPRFDRILIDAPCSNSGVLARRPEARYHQTHQHIASVTRLQDQLLSDTAVALKPGGRLVYSTCSVWPEENEERVRAFLFRRGDYRLIEEQATLPSLDPSPTGYHDGGYWAALRRE